MRKLVAVVVVLALAVVASLAMAQEKAPAEKPKLVTGSPDSATYADMMPGVTQAVIWGDPKVGPFGAYTKMAPGFDAGMHTHTNDSWLVVLKGAYLYRDEAGDKRIGPGEFLRIPAGHPHWSGGDPKDGALFYQEGSAAFDLVPLKK